jgi:hypothetical protein
MTQVAVKDETKVPVQAPRAAPPPVPEKKVIPLNQTRMKEADYACERWFVSVPSGTAAKDLLDPTYWRNLGDKLKPLAHVTAVTEDSTWHATFLVVAAQRLWAKLHMLSYTDLSATKADTPLTDDQNYSVEWKGPLGKFAVIRKSDAATLKDGFTTMLEGHQWLDGHLKAMGR